MLGSTIISLSTHFNHFAKNQLIYDAFHIFLGELLPHIHTFLGELLPYLHIFLGELLNPIRASSPPV